jgi:hypothetical protein
MGRRIDSRIDIRAFAPGDADAVRALFVRVNRLLSPEEMREAFETYIARSLTEEIDRVADYYSERNGGFWVAVDGGRLIGMFGLEPSADGAMECVGCTSIPTSGAEGLRDECWISPSRNAGDAAGRDWI